MHDDHLLMYEFALDVSLPAVSSKPLSAVQATGPDPVSYLGFL